jgi:N-acetylmuramoyl-L-alanine amidase
MAKLVVLDPGHGGTDPGAGGGGLREAVLTLTIGKRVRDALLRDFDVRVEMTRTTNREVALERRAAIANDLRADYFVSIHINSGGGTGYEDFIHRSASASGETARRRTAVHDAVMGFMRAKGVRDRGKKSAGFLVLRKTAMPAILTENLFVDTPADAGLLADDGFLTGVAEAHAKGIAAALALPRKAA